MAAVGWLALLSWLAGCAAAAPALLPTLNTLCRTAPYRPCTASTCTAPAGAQVRRHVSKHRHRGAHRHGAPRVLPQPVRLCSLLACLPWSLPGCLPAWSLPGRLPNRRMLLAHPPNHSGGCFLLLPSARAVHPPFPPSFPPPPACPPACLPAATPCGRTTSSPSLCPSTPPTSTPSPLSRTSRPGWWSA